MALAYRDRSEVRPPAAKRARTLTDPASRRIADRPSGAVDGKEASEDSEPVARFRYDSACFVVPPAAGGELPFRIDQRKLFVFGGDPIAALRTWRWNQSLATDEQVELLKLVGDVEAVMAADFDVWTALGSRFTAPDVDRISPFISAQEGRTLYSLTVGEWFSRALSDQMRSAIVSRVIDGRLAAASAYGTLSYACVKCRANIYVHVDVCPFAHSLCHHCCGCVSVVEKYLLFPTARPSNTTGSPATPQERPRPAHLHRPLLHKPTWDPKGTVLYPQGVCTLGAPVVSVAARQPQQHVSLHPWDTCDGDDLGYDCTRLVWEGDSVAEDAEALLHFADTSLLSQYFFDEAGSITTSVLGLFAQDEATGSRTYVVGTPAGETVRDSSGRSFWSHQAITTWSLTVVPLAGARF